MTAAMLPWVDDDDDDDDDDDGTVQRYTRTGPEHEGGHAPLGAAARIPVRHGHASRDTTLADAAPLPAGGGGRAQRHEPLPVCTATCFVNLSFYSKFILLRLQIFALKVEH